MFNTNFVTLFIGFVFILTTSSTTFAQRKYIGKTTQIESQIDFTSLIWAGGTFKELNLKFKSSDTLQNGKIIFLKSNVGAIAQVKCEIIVEAGVLVQFQVNVYTTEHTKKLLHDCEQFYGKPKKSSSTKINQLLIWENTAKSGKRINTVLITGNKNKKAELVSWQL